MCNTIQLVGAVAVAVVKVDVVETQRDNEEISNKTPEYQKKPPKRTSKKRNERKTPKHPEKHPDTSKNISKIPRIP